MTPAIPAISLSLSLSRSLWLRFNERNNMRYLFINVRYGQSLWYAPLPLPLPPSIAIRKFHMQMYPAGVEPGNGEWLREREESRGQWARHVHSACGSRWAEGGEQAAAINHIHSLPVERAFNLHAELHIAYGRCLPTFARSVVRSFVGSAWTESESEAEAVLRHTKVFNFKCLINLYNRIKLSSTKAPLRTVGWNYCAHIENNYENNLNYACCLLCVCIN